MHAPGLIPLLIVALLAVLLFLRPGKLSALMEDLGKGIRGFRKGLDEPKDKDAKADPATPEAPPRQIRDMSREGGEQLARDREHSA